jgi:hypothetical protein
MVRAYFPQSFPNDLETNTDYPPQGSEIGGGPTSVDNELHEESGGVFGNLIYNDGSESGNVKINEGPLDFEIIEETVGVFDNASYDDGVETGDLLIDEV